jgi:hypothetical protein
VYYGEEAAVSEMRTKQRNFNDAGSATRSVLKSNNSRERWMSLTRMRELYIINEIGGGLISRDCPLKFVWCRWRS